MNNRSKASFKFPYKEFKGADQPIISITLKGPRRTLIAEAFVNSGATISIFDAAIASKLGINYTKGELRYTLVGDGSYIPIYVNTIPVKLGPVSFRAKIGFCTHLGAGINLKGQSTRELWPHDHNIFCYTPYAINHKPFLPRRLPAGQAGIGFECIGIKNIRNLDIPFRDSYT